MTTKEQRAAAAEIVARERALSTEVVQDQGVNGDAGTFALAILSEEDFENRLAILKRGRDRIRTVQRELMVENEDFGVIPGTPRPSLLKPGAEKLADIYRLRARMDAQFIQPASDQQPPIRWVVRCDLHLGTFDGPVVASGFGEANSWEKRYRRETKVCPNCEAPKIIKSKYDPGWYCLNCKAKFGKDDQAIVGQTSNVGDVQSQWDLSNTILKMAEKRAHVSTVLRACAASGVFAQDVEDLADTRPDLVVEHHIDPAPVPDDPEQVMQAVLDITGGEEVKVTDSNIENVERGGRTSGANEAQIAEVRRLVGELSWLSKDTLAYVYSWDPDAADDATVPVDGRAARGTLSSYLEQMSGDRIGQLVTSLTELVELKQAREDSRDREPEQVDHE